MSEVEEIKQKLKLTPLPLEGGFIRELRIILTSGQSPLEGQEEQEDPSDLSSSSIYYLLHGTEVSKWHRTNGIDEYFVWNKGTTPMILHEIDLKNCYKRTILGDPLLVPGAVFQYLIKANHWMTAELERRLEDDYCLISCVTAPAFQWSHFETLSKDGKGAELRKRCPEIPFDDRYFTPASGLKELNTPEVSL